MSKKRQWTLKDGSTSEREYKRDTRGLHVLPEGVLPKPPRLNQIIRIVDRRHTDLMTATRPVAQMIVKDPRTIESYRRTLEGLRNARSRIEEMIEELERLLGLKEERDGR